MAPVHHPDHGALRQPIAQHDYQGKRLAYWGHITRQNTITMMLALKQAGAEIVIGSRRQHG